MPLVILGAYHDSLPILVHQVEVGPMVLLVEVGVILFYLVGAYGHQGLGLETIR